MAEKNDDVKTEVELRLAALATELSSLSQRISGHNIEWPEDSQERNSDRKLKGSADDDKIASNSVHEIHGTARATSDADYGKRMRESEDMFGTRMTRFDEVYGRYRNLWSDLNRDLGLLHKEVKSEVVDSNEIASIEIATQYAVIADALKDAIKSGDSTAIQAAAKLAEAVTPKK